MQRIPDPLLKKTHTTSTSNLAPASPRKANTSSTISHKTEPKHKSASNTHGKLKNGQAPTRTQRKTLAASTQADEPGQHTKSDAKSMHTKCKINKIDKISSQTGNSEGSVDRLGVTDAGIVEFKLDTPLAFDNFTNIQNTGRFVIIKNNSITASGIII